MSDETTIVKDQGTIFPAGPPLVKAATGETVTAEELGGADVHTRISGVADHLADDDRHALELARRAVANLPGVNVAARDVREPLYAAEELCGVIPQSARTPFDVREIIEREADASEFDEFMAHYGTTLGCGYSEF